MDSDKCRYVKPEGTYGDVKCPSRRPPTTGSALVANTLTHQTSNENISYIIVNKDTTEKCAYNMQTTSWDDVFNNDDLNSAYNLFISKLKVIIDYNIHIKSIKKNNKIT